MKLYYIFASGIALFEGNQSVVFSLTSEGSFDQNLKGFIVLTADGIEENILRLRVVLRTIINMHGVSE